jgi:POT family proton-dependent oligopeptide transporter
MTAPVAAGGLGFETTVAGAVYGLYTSMVYMTSLPGGWIADRLIGQRRAVLYGGIIIACGHFSMAVQSLTSFYIGLALIVVGTGLLKGNAAVIVGALYPPRDVRRDAGFSIYYMGINLGAFIAPLVCGYLGQRVNWHIGFGAAGVGMVAGVLQYVAGAKYLGDAGLHPAPAESPEAAVALRTRAMLFGAITLALVVAFAFGLYSGALPLTAKQIADAAGWVLLAIVVAFFGWLFSAADWTPTERRRLYAIAALFVASLIFWSQFEQAGSTLKVFGWTFPSSYYQTLQPLFIISFAPIFAWIWLRLGRHEPSSPAKFGLGLLCVGSGFSILVVAAQLSANGVKVSPWWLVATYLLHTWGELSLSPVGLSATSKLAPTRVVGLMMGVFYLAISVGNFIGGRLASLYEAMPLARLFGAIGAVGICAGLVMFALTPPIKRLMGDVN